jgi:hypothetical protein
MPAAWLSAYLAPITILSDGTAQSRDYRVNFRNGFTLSQVADAAGVNMLTIDTEVGNAVYEPTILTAVLRNNAGAIKATTVVATTGFTYSPAKSIERDAKFSTFVIPSLSTWTYDGLGQPVAAAANQAYLGELDVPDGATLLTVTVHFTPATGHGAVPAALDMPTFTVATVDEQGGFAVLGTIQDAEALVVDYEVYRTLTVDLGAGVTVNADARVIVAFNSEKGANNVNGTTIHRIARWTAEVAALVP